MKKNIILEKSFKFALKIVEEYKYLIHTKKEYVLSKQLLRSGTSIGANVQESTAAQSKADFINKLSIASKEARETKYWLLLLKESEYIPKSDLIDSCEEIIKILTSIIKTSQERESE